MSLEKEVMITSLLRFNSFHDRIILTFVHIDNDPSKNVRRTLDFKEAANLRNELSYWLISQQQHRNRLISNEALAEFTRGKHTIKCYLRNDGQVEARCSCESKWVYSESEVSPEYIIQVLEAHVLLWGVVDDNEASPENMTTITNKFEPYCKNCHRPRNEHLGALLWCHIPRTIENEISPVSKFEI